jgi:ubiquitin-activating enzyme E1 C
MVQDRDEAFYKQFKLIISGLDNIEARRWLNSVIVGTRHVTTLQSDRIIFITALCSGLPAF